MSDADMDKDALAQRYEQAKYYKDRWLGEYEELYQYVLPDRHAMNVRFHYRDGGRPLTNSIWESTAMLAAYQRANDIHSLLFPKGRTWAKLTLHPHLHGSANSKAFTDEVEKFNEKTMFYLESSNLHGIVTSSNLDLVGGTGVIWFESPSDENPLYYRSIPAVSTFLEYTNDYSVNTAWFLNQLTGRQILKQFPDYNGKMVKQLQEQCDETFDVVYGQVEMDDGRFYIYVFLDDDRYEYLHEKESDYKQVLIYRDRVRPGETEGRGIGLDMLPTIKDLNRVVEYARKNLAYKADPPMLYDANSYFNPFSVQKWSGMMIPRSPGSRPIEAIEMPEYAEVYKHIELLQQQIQKGFQVDPLGEISDPVRSATEIKIREERAQRTNATDMSRLINELPREIYQNAAIALNKRGLLRDDGREIKDFDPQHLHFEFKSPLFDEQNRENLHNFAQGLQLLQQYFGEGANLAALKPDAVKDFLQDNLRLPSRLFKNDEELKQVLNAMAQQTQAQQAPEPKTAAEQPETPPGQGVTI